MNLIIFLKKSSLKKMKQVFSEPSFAYATCYDRHFRFTLLPKKSISSNSTNIQNLIKKKKNKNTTSTKKNLPLATQKQR